MSDSDSDDEQVPFGTPLDPIEEDEIPTKRKYQEAPDQYAIDAHGRRRFHGAFTGGFSAGYGNTVGTPEGWTPSTFKSSRSEKAQVSARCPEDFMDEEDRSEFGIAPRQMQTQGEFSGQKRRLQRYHDGPIPGEPVLEQLLKAVHETAAVRMLRAMGWKPGQGTGDRVSREEKKRAKEQHKVYGCYMPPEIKQSTEQRSDSESSESDYDLDTLFAPDDYEPYILRRKDDRFGLGYSGLSRHSVLGGAGEGRSHLLMNEKGKKVSIRGQAFGVGALEADDDDIYAADDMSRYDYAIGGPDTQLQKKTKPKGGANVLEGFVRSSRPLPPVPSHPVPALPRGYVPAPAGERRSRFEPTTVPHRDQGLGRHKLTAEARGALLGETPVPKLQDTAQTSQNPATNTDDPIAKITGRNVSFVSTNKEDKTEENFISIVDTGREVSKTFRPFMSDPKKQARYEKYLRDKDSYMIEWDGRTDALSEWERNRELVEFEQAAKLYKPLSGVMGDRFTHASEPDEALNPLCADAKSSTNYGLATADQIAAAERGVYGLMTRTQAKWRPEPLVCKRFNVPDPGGDRSEAKTEEKPKVSYSIFSYLESSVHDKDSFTKEQSRFSGSKTLNTSIPRPVATENKTNIDKDKVENKIDKPSPSTSTEDTGFSKRLTVAELFLKESEKDQKNNEAVTDTIEKFDKMDLYKSIFLSDSENEDDANKDTNNEIPNANDFVDKPKNVERNTSPPRGIFANIDFDEINSWRRKTETEKSTKEEPSKKAEANIDKNKEMSDKPNENIDMAVDVYGPKIPENLQKRLEEPEKEDFRPIFRSRGDKDSDIHVVDSSSSDSWVDAEEVKKRHKKKSKKHKVKHKHKKGKHKKKNK